MKKFFLIIFVNIFIFSLMLSPLNYLLLQDDNIFQSFPVLYKKYLKKDFPEDKINSLLFSSDEYEISDDYVEPFLAKHIVGDDENYNLFCGTERVKNNESFSGNPIVVMGCSYAYGHGLKTEETFPYLLSKTVNRPVYNLADCGEQAIHSLKKINEQDSKVQDKIKNADYFVYVYMWNHLARYLSNYILIPNYESLLNLSQIELFLMKIPIFKYFIISIHRALIYKGYPISDSTHGYLIRVMKYVNSEIKKISPNAKFIIIIYNEKIPSNSKNPDIMLIYDYDFWREVEKETGATVVFTQDITGIKFDKNYKLKEDIADWHPSPKAWQVFTKPFAEKYIK